METPRCKVRAALKADADFISKHLRDSDLLELADAGLNKSAVVESFEKSQYCRCMCAPDGKPFAIWGCGCIDEAYGLGSVWMLATDEIENHRMAFGRICAREIKRMLSIFPLLTNYVHASNLRSQKWLASLGAELTPERCMANDEKFRQFWFQSQGV